MKREVKLKVDAIKSLQIVFGKTRAVVILSWLYTLC